MLEPHLTGEKATMLTTLYARALDAGSPNPVLNDVMALEVVRQLDFDFSHLGLPRGTEASSALRCRFLDDWAREFLAEHPRATVLHLGCGLDTRVHRLSPGPDVAWFDVDHPEAIDLRRQLLPTPENYEMIGASVTDPGWLARVPTDRPTLVIAEGLLLYLHEASGQEMFRRIMDHVPNGQFIFDGYNRRGIRLHNRSKALRVAKATVYWGMEGCADLEAIDPRLRCVTSASSLDVFNSPSIRWPYRILMAMMRRFPALRKLAAFYRLEF